VRSGDPGSTELWGRRSRASLAQQAGKLLGDDAYLRLIPAGLDIDTHLRAIAAHAQLEAQLDMGGARTASGE
jgi:hypothetical protein